MLGHQLDLDVSPVHHTVTWALLVTFVNRQALQANDLALEFLLTEHGLRQGNFPSIPLDPEARVREGERRLQTDHVLHRSLDGDVILREGEGRVHRLLSLHVHDAAARPCRLLRVLAANPLRELQRLAEGELAGLGLLGLGHVVRRLGIHRRLHRAWDCLGHALPQVFLS